MNFHNIKLLGQEIGIAFAKKKNMSSAQYWQKMSISRSCLLCISMLIVNIPDKKARGFSRVET